MVKPGDTLETECELSAVSRGMFYFAKRVAGRVNGKVCVSAEFVCARQGVSPAERNRLCLRNCLSRTAGEIAVRISFVPEGNGHPHRGGVFQGGRGVYPWRWPMKPSASARRRRRTAI